jgi:hypothetical protein
MPNFLGQHGKQIHKFPQPVTLLIVWNTPQHEQFNEGWTIPHQTTFSVPFARRAQGLVYSLYFSHFNPQIKRRISGKKKSLKSLGVYLALGGDRECPWWRDVRLVYMGQSDVIKIGWRWAYCLIWRPISCVKNIFCLQLTMCFQLPDIPYQQMETRIAGRTAYCGSHTAVPFYHLEPSLFFLLAKFGQL